MAATGTLGFFVCLCMLFYGSESRPAANDYKKTLSQVRKLSSEQVGKFFKGFSPEEVGVIVDSIPDDGFKAVLASFSKATIGKFVKGIPEDEQKELIQDFDLPSFFAKSLSGLPDDTLGGIVKGLNKAKLARDVKGLPKDLVGKLIIEKIPNAELGKAIRGLPEDTLSTTLQALPQNLFQKYKQELSKLKPDGSAQPVQPEEPIPSDDGDSEPDGNAFGAIVNELGLFQAVKFLVQEAVKELPLLGDGTLLDYDGIVIAVVQYLLSNEGLLGSLLSGDGKGLLGGLLGGGDGKDGGGLLGSLLGGGGDGKDGGGLLGGLLGGGGDGKDGGGGGLLGGLLGGGGDGGDGNGGGGGGLLGGVLGK